MNYILVGRRIREYRVRKNMSQAELAEQVELSEAHIGFIENARKHPSLDAFVRIANALDTTVDNLLTGYQRNDSMQYSSDIAVLMKDCSTNEKHALYKMLVAMKSILREDLLLLQSVAVEISKLSRSDG